MLPYLCNHDIIFCSLVSGHIILAYLLFLSYKVLLFAFRIEITVSPVLIQKNLLFIFMVCFPSSNSNFMIQVLVSPFQFVCSLNVSFYCLNFHICELIAESEIFPNEITNRVWKALINCVIWVSLYNCLQIKYYLLNFPCNYWPPFRLSLVSWSEDHDDPRSTALKVSANSFAIECTSSMQLKFSPLQQVWFAHSVAGTRMKP